MTEKAEARDQEENAMITFLKLTKEGKYSPIGKTSSLADLRQKEQREPSYNDEDYYYSIR